MRLNKNGQLGSLINSQNLAVLKKKEISQPEN